MLCVCVGEARYLQLCSVSHNNCVVLLSVGRDVPATMQCLSNSCVVLLSVGRDVPATMQCLSNNCVVVDRELCPTNCQIFWLELALLFLIYQEPREQGFTAARC